MFTTFTTQRNIRYWKRHGRIPWQRGYHEYKEAMIRQVLAESKIPQQRYGERLDERIVEFPWLVARLPRSAAVMLDAGSTLNHDYILDQPVFQNKQLAIMTLAPERDNFWQRGISYVWGDLRNTPWRDNWFDAITCISTLEHVGMDNSIYTDNRNYQEDNRSSYLEVIREFKRILKPGGHFFLTVPYGRYKQCGFQQVFDHAMLDQVSAAFGGTVIEQTFFQYFADGWQQSTQAACEDCDYFNIHETKEFEADYAAAARAVACLILQK